MSIIARLFSKVNDHYKLTEDSKGYYIIGELLTIIKNKVIVNKKQ